MRMLNIIAILLSTLSFGQVKDENPFERVEGLTLLDSVAYNDIVGGFRISDGYGGYNFQLDSNLSFQKYDFSCIARFRVDSGSWAIKNKNIVVLNSKKQNLCFEVVKFDKFYFFILPSQRRNFIRDLNALRKELKNTKPVHFDNKTFSKQFLIAYNLTKKYYAKELDELPGT